MRLPKRQHLLTALWLILASLSIASAKGPHTLWLEEFTSPEVVQRIESGYDRILIPTGGTEQNGDFMPLGKHNLLMVDTAERIARALGNTLIAPVIAYVPEGSINPPEGHMQFAGTISLREETFAMLLEDTARSLKQAGFTKIYFIGDSGGNQAMQSRVAAQLSKEWRTEQIDIRAIDDYYGAQKEQAEWVKKRLPSIEDPTGHAGFVNLAELVAVGGEGAIRPAILKTYQALFPGMTDAQMLQQLARMGEDLLALKINAAVKQIRK